MIQNNFAKNLDSEKYSIPQKDLKKTLCRITTYLVSDVAYGVLAIK